MNDTISRQFEEIVVRYPSVDLCNYPEYKGKPYFSIRYKENGEDFIGYGTYNPEVLSQYLRDYFMPLAQPEERTDKRTETRACDSIGRQVAIDAVDAIGHIATMPDGDKCIRRSAVKYTLSMLPPAEPEHEWIPVTERLPDNADHPEAFCPRYQVTTPYGVTEGWYRPYDHEKGGQWYALFWFMSHRYEIWNIDFERGDVPKVIGEAPVMAWRPFPEAYKEVKKHGTD